MPPSNQSASPPAGPASGAGHGRRSRFLVASALFFCSGALGLGYELIWIRKAALVVGASQIALATVLTSFFLGLGLGSLVVGRIRRARMSSLRMYGVFELGIGVYALLFPQLFALLEMTYGALYPLAAGSGALLFALRFLLLFALCLPPTFLMGGTLPLLLDGLVEEDRRVGSQTSLLYGLNILGAVFGVLATCYWAIPQLGMDATSRVGGLGNLAIGALALYIFRAARPLYGKERPVERPARMFTVLAFTSGAVAIAWQVMHARFFGLLDVTTIHTTSMLLAVYLLGLSLGSMLLAPILSRGRDPLRVFSVVQLLAPAIGLFAFHAVRWIDISSHLGALTTQDGRIVPLETMQVRPAFAFFSEDADRVFFGPLAQIGLVVFLPVLFLGACLPALIAGATRHSSGLRKISGHLVFWNTLGSSCGAFIAGYLLLPGLGLQRGLALIGLASLGLALFARRGLPLEARRYSPAFLSMAAVGALALVGFTFFSGDLTRTTIERYGLGARLDDPTWQSGDIVRPELIEIVEGTVGTAYIYDSAEQVRLASGGVSFAAVAKHGIPGQAVQGHIPILLFPGEGTPRNCLGICMGSGQSFGAMLMYGIEKLDVVDIAPSLVELSLRHFAPYNHGLETDPRVEFHFDDGRHHVQRSPDAYYDVISMEPPPPNADGVYSLYSLDFYREAQRVLTDDGLLMQWLPLYRISPEDAQGIVKTQAAIFPETFVVKQAEQDFMVLSYKTRPAFSQEAIRRRCETFAKERMVAGARWADGCQSDMASLEGVLSTLLIGPREVADMDAPAPYEDDTQLLCYGTGDRWVYQRYQGKHLARISYAALPASPFEEFAGYFAPPLDAAQIAAATMERAVSLAYFREPDPTVLRELERVASSTRSDADRRLANLHLAAIHDSKLDKPRAFDHLAAAIALVPTDATPEHVQVARTLVRNHFAVYRDEIEARIEDLRLQHPSAPLVQAAIRAFDEAEVLEEERRARYLFPER